VWEVKNGRITDYRGTFSEYREYVQRQQVFAQNEKAGHKKGDTRRKGEPNAEKALARLEREIEKSEAAVAALDVEAAQHASDYQRLMEIDAKKAELNSALDGLYAKWEELAQ
jgi:ATP-binding cassette subfamily F protein 3